MMPFAKKHSGMFGSARCPTCYSPIENKIARMGEAMHNMMGDCNCHRDDHEMGNEIGHVIMDDDISKFPSWCMLADSKTMVAIIIVCHLVTFVWLVQMMSLRWILSAMMKADL